MANILQQPLSWAPSRWNESSQLYRLGSDYSTGSAYEDRIDFMDLGNLQPGDRLEGTLRNISGGPCSVSVFIDGFVISESIPDGQETSFSSSVPTGTESIFISVSRFPFVEVEVEPTGGGPGPSPNPSSSGDSPHFHVYELDKGWSFDGAYIPHFLEMNWYFGDDPFTDKTIQKVRIHGLSKGLTQLQLSVAGMQHDYDSDFTEPQFINIPRNAVHISEEYIPVTNYVDSSNWGVSHQLRFEGSNTDLSKPEPSHVLQVLALQGSPQNNGKRIN